MFKLDENNIRNDYGMNKVIYYVCFDKLNEEFETHIEIIHPEYYIIIAEFNNMNLAINYTNELNKIREKYNYK